VTDAGREEVRPKVDDLARRRDEVGSMVEIRERERSVREGILLDLATRTRYRSDDVLRVKR
jgi:hypothetical protein